MNNEDTRPEAAELLANIKTNLEGLNSILTQSRLAEDDLIYRFYHHSFKVYYIQQYTLDIVAALKELAPTFVEPISKFAEPLCDKLNAGFVSIVSSGTGKVFELEHNRRWHEVTRPMLEAYFHAKYFLEQIIDSSKLKFAPNLLPSGWAAVLYLYGLR